MADQNQEREVILLTIDIATLVYLTGFALILALILVLRLKHWKDTLEKLETRAQQVQAILLERLAHQNKFLNQLRKELHESPCQLLFVAQINLNMAEDQRPDDEQILLFTSTNRLITQTIQELRSLMRRLEEAAAPAESLTAGIRHELDKISNTRQTYTRLMITGRAYALESAQEIILLKMIEQLWCAIPAETLPEELRVEIDYATRGFSLKIIMANLKPLNDGQAPIYLRQAATLRQQCRLIDFEYHQQVEDNGSVVLQLFAPKPVNKRRYKHYCW